MTGRDGDHPAPPRTVGHAATGAVTGRATGEATGAASGAAELFEGVYGHPAEVVAAAPGRVNLIGEHTDYNDGLVLPLALPHRTEAAMARRSDGMLALWSAARPAPVALLPLAALAPPGRPRAATGPEPWTDYVAGVLWALREAGHPLGDGLSVALHSTVPAGAGLSSSAALELACATAVNALAGLGLTPVDLAAVGRRAEQEYAGMPCGAMDQLASACCTEGHLLLLDTADLSMRQIPFDPAAHGLRLLVADTGVNHQLTDGGYADRRAGCERAARLLGLHSLRAVGPDTLAAALARLGESGEEGARLRPLVRHVVTENRRVEQVVDAVEGRLPRAVGPLLTAGHRSLRDDFRVSCAALDTVVDAAVAAGALGARMTGGGFGGSAVILAEEPAVAAVRDAVVAAARVAGHPEPRIFDAAPSPGAVVRTRAGKGRRQATRLGASGPGTPESGPPETGTPESGPPEPGTPESGPPEPGAAPG